jgi:anti-sigma-K factor RskA
LATLFFHWVMLYANVIGELFGEDREEAMAVIDDDTAFDRWMKRWDQKQRMQARSKGKQVPVDNDRYAKVYGGEDT